MKFVSKSSNLCIILRPGIPGQPMTGTPPKPAVFVRFQDGIANVEDESLAEMMRAHPGFDSDFILAEVEAPDPFAYLRTESEPVHSITEMKYGSPEKTYSSKPKNVGLPPEILKLVQDMADARMEAVLPVKAMELAKAMLPEMVKETLKQLVNEKESVDAPVAAKGVPEAKAAKKVAGRPKKVAEAKEEVTE